MSALHQNLEARALHPDLGSDAVEGRISFSGRVMRFQGQDVSFEIPLGRLDVTLHEDDERLFFSDPRQPGLQLITPDRSLLACRTVPQVQQIRKRLEARLGRQEIWHRLKLVVYFFLACGFIAWIGMLTIRGMVNVIVARIPPAWELEYGNEVMKDLRKEVELVNDTNRLAQLAELAAPLLRTFPTSGTEYRFHIMKEIEPNAFALPGGHIIVTTGLLRLADDPAELLGAIAHEVAHVTQKHGFRQQIASAGPVVIVKIFLRGRGSPSIVAGSSALLISQSFSQEYEKEADDTGWDYLVAANVDPRGMTSIFRKLEMFDFQFLPQAFSSHPSMEKRIARLEKKWAELPRKSEFITLRPIGDDGR